MTLAATPSADPYIVALPGPTSPVITAAYLVAAHAHLNARYADPVWSLAPLTEHPSAPRYGIHWKNCPPAFQAELRLAAWTMLNGQLRPTFMKERATRRRNNGMRSRLGVDGMVGAVSTWMSLATWLAEQGITTLAACDTAALSQRICVEHAIAEPKQWRPLQRYIGRANTSKTPCWASPDWSPTATPNSKDHPVGSVGPACPDSYRAQPRNSRAGRPKNFNTPT